MSIGAGKCCAAYLSNRDADCNDSPPVITTAFPTTGGRIILERRSKNE
jgi:hypothetical protein